MPYISVQDEAKFFARLGFRYYQVAGYTTALAAATAVETPDIALAAGQRCSPADKFLAAIQGAPLGTTMIQAITGARCVTPNNVRLNYTNASAGALTAPAHTVGVLVFPDFTAG